MGVLKVRVDGQWIEIDDGAGGDAGPENYVHTQSTPAAVWTITHPLQFRPNVTIVDTSGDQVEGDVVYTSGSVVTVSFSAAFGGTAYLS